MLALGASSWAFCSVSASDSSSPELLLLRATLYAFCASAWSSCPSSASDSSLLELISSSYADDSLGDNLPPRIGLPLPCICGPWYLGLSGVVTPTVGHMLRSAGMGAGAVNPATAVSYSWSLYVDFDLT